MVDLSRQLVFFMMGSALQLQLSIPASAAPDTDYGASYYNFYSDWMSPGVRSES